ncbi:MAG: hypothetical protein ACK4VW_10255, partial [Anaerolineales bacterium]
MRLPLITFALSFFALLSIFLGGSVPFSASPVDRVHDFTRPVEFNYLAWTGEAWLVKASQFSLSMPAPLSRASRYELVAEYFDLVARLERNEVALLQIYANPQVADKESASELLRAERERLQQRYVLILP